MSKPIKYTLATLFDSKNIKNVFLMDFQKKRDVIKGLKQKVLEKNPDEFYFNMTRTQMKVNNYKII